MVHHNVAGFIKLLTFAFARFICLGVDCAAAMTYGDCARGCGEYSKNCHTMLLSSATFNGFALATVLLFLAIRWTSEERSYSESHCITLIILVLGILLKIVDLILPLVLATGCFTPPYYSGMASAGCDVPCVVGELFAIYAMYAFAKVAIGVLDLWHTGFQFERTSFWYRTKDTFETRV